ncbi:glycosyltransferase [Microcoleus sp. FACHB-1515]|uniref:glycosyltransferase n=1 Tax=Cyanophyceae TaxID=3028117 RepID=UPI0016822952|nr:glycosyltransferase [Microcoleus sp. FACHB-1515]MBD2089984.1 glycosyltransferase [Microcoleus sp. FACHB-1515]
MPLKPLHLHLWIPALSASKGGIQMYSTSLLEAIRSIAPTSQIQVFIKHDLPTSEPLCFGHYPPRVRTAAFALQLLRSSLLDPPDLIISTHVNFAPIALVAHQLRNVPYWVAAHGIDVWNLRHPLKQAALQRADRILAVSRTTRDRLLSQALDSNRVIVLPCTFAPDRFSIASKPDDLLRRYGLTADQPVILTVARLESIDRAKGYDQILHALPQIRCAIPNVHYLLVGTGGDRFRIEQLIDRLQVRSSVTLAGFVPDAELPAHYNLCDLFAMPSQQEGFGIVYLEAIASGKPTLGGDRDGAVDALCSGELGVLVNPTDIETIAQTIIQILQRTFVHPLLYQPELLRQAAIDRFGFPSFQQQIAHLLLEVKSRH